jgi:carboxyl-terminal processing protease
MTILLRIGVLLMHYNEIEEKDNDILNNERFKISSRRGRILFLVLIFLLTNVFSVFIGNRIAISTGAKVAVEKSDYEKMKDLEAVIDKDENEDLNEALSQYDGVLKFKKLFEIKELLEKYYYSDLDEDKMVEGAIKGLTESLQDPYTVFMNQKEYEDFNTGTVGSYVGVGLQVGVKEEKITVIAPFDNSPAKNAGIITGDVITRVNDKDVAGKDLELAVSMMKGKEGETVNLTLYREGKGLIEVSVKRAKIVIQTVKGEMLADNIGYIQLSMFDEKTDEDFIKTAKDLKTKGMKGLILDLRGNPGGLLDTCENISSQFVEKGKLIVSQKFKDGTSASSKASEGGLLIGMPLVVLTDAGTASASEILSGVVRDYNIGTIIGTKTFGKGVVQTIVRTGSGTALKVTISKYYTPSGENIDKVGINPHIEVVYPKELLTKPYDRATDPQFSKAVEVIKGKLK